MQSSWTEVRVLKQEDLKIIRQSFAQSYPVIRMIEDRRILLVCMAVFCFHGISICRSAVQH